MPLFFHQELLSVGDTFILSPDEARHAVKVLRHRVGDMISFSDGKGFVYKGVILNDNYQNCEVKVISSRKGDDVKNFSIHLAISPIKNPSRFEWLLEKATEAGIGEITPLVSIRTEKSNLKPERFKNILVSAMKQSGRTLLPTINPPKKFEEIIKLKRDNPAFIAWCGSKELPFLGKLMPVKTDTLVLIGPEGDFTKEEFDLAISHNFQPASLGKAILRTETAGLMTVMMFNFINAL